MIHVMRNPKDIAVSLYHHLIQMKGFKDRGFFSNTEMFLNGGLLPGKMLLLLLFLACVNSFKTGAPLYIYRERERDRQRSYAEAYFVKPLSFLCALLGRGAVPLYNNVPVE